MVAKEYSEQQLNQALEQENLLLLVDFFAEWCPPCKLMSPLMDELSRKLEGKVLVVKVNVDTHPQCAKDFKVTCLPTFLFLKGGKEAHKWEGRQDYEEMEKKIMDLLSS